MLEETGSVIRSPLSKQASLHWKDQPSALHVSIDSLASLFSLAFLHLSVMGQLFPTVFYFILAPCLSSSNKTPTPHPECWCGMWATPATCLHTVWVSWFIFLLTVSSGLATGRGAGSKQGCGRGPGGLFPGGHKAPAL